MALQCRPRGAWKNWGGADIGDGGRVKGGGKRLSLVYWQLETKAQVEAGGEDPTGWPVCRGTQMECGHGEPQEGSV